MSGKHSAATQSLTPRSDTIGSTGLPSLLAELLIIYKLATNIVKIYFFVIDWFSTTVIVKLGRVSMMSTQLQSIYRANWPMTFALLRLSSSVLTVLER